jgi:hypothetical protein
VLGAAQRAQKTPQRRTVDVFEDQEQRTVDLADVVRLHDVRVMEHAEDLRFGGEHAEKLRVLAVGGRIRLTTTVRSKPPGPE